jgi:5'-nucleotidase
MSQRFRILLTNDDGYRAVGLRRLYDELAQENDVVIVAPQKEQSGTGHAFTYTTILRCSPIDDALGMKGFFVDGTPSDCVKLGLARLFKTPPDIVVSGINAGENTGMSGHYSGTLAAAREACFWGVAGIAFSLSSGAEGHLGAYAGVSRKLIGKIAHLHAGGFGKKHDRVYFNINFPACSPASSKGYRITRQSCAFFDDRYRIETESPAETGYLLQGSKIKIEESDEFDSRALKSGYIAITPLHYDATAGNAMTEMEECFKTVSY